LSGERKRFFKKNLKTKKGGFKMSATKENSVDTLQIQKNPVKKKALPLNRSSQDDSYCNGSHPVSGAGPSLNTKNGASLLLRLTAVAVALTIWTPSSTASASTGSSPALNTQNAVNAIIGEAEAEPMAGKIAIAEVIRRRGSLRGIYGINSPRVRLASRTVRKECELAWAKKGTNLTRGATVWGSESDVAKWKARAKKYPRHWFNRMKQTARIGAHFFFAERKSK
jgi:hypothetical protein